MNTNKYEITEEHRARARELLAQGYHQTSGAHGHIARLPPGKTGIEALLDHAHKPGVYLQPTPQETDDWIRTMGEASAGDYFLRCCAGAELRITIDHVTFRAFRELGGRPYNESFSRAQAKLADQNTPAGDVMMRLYLVRDLTVERESMYLCSRQSRREPSRDLVLGAYDVRNNGPDPDKVFSAHVLLHAVTPCSAWRLSSLRGVSDETRSQLLAQALNNFAQGAPVRIPAKLRGLPYLGDTRARYVRGSGGWWEAVR